MESKKNFMQLALKLAQKGKGKVSPNPLVGTMIVKDGKIVGEGYHAYFGGAHAEIIALSEAGKNSLGATLYTNFEPCVHYGKTPPCVPEIIKAGIKEVVIGMIDPNPVNAGRGVEALKKAGIKVSLGVEEKESRKLNEEFINYIKKQAKSKCLQE